MTNMFYTYKELVIVVSHPAAVPEVIADVNCNRIEHPFC